MRLRDQAALMTLGRLAERIVGILSGIFLVRLLSKSAYGTFLQVSLIGSLTTSLILLGLPQSLLFILPQEEPARRRRFIRQTAAITLAASAVAAFLVAGAHRSLARILHNADFDTIGLVVAAYVVLFSLDRLVEPTLIALQEARLASLLTTVSSVLLLVATLAPAWAGWSIGRVYTCIILVYLARLAFFAGRVARMPAAGPSPLFERASVRRQVAFSLPLGLAGISGQWNKQMDGLIVSFFFVPDIYAVYARGAFELPLIDLLPFTLATVILPRLVELWRAGKPAEFTALWNRSIQISSLLVFPAFAYCLLFAREIIVVLFTEAYSASVPVFQVYLLALPFRLTSYGVLLQAVGDTRTILRSSAAGLILNAAIAFLLCPIIGPVGAAIGFVGSQIFQIVYLLNAIRIKATIPLGRLMPWPRLGVALGIAAVAAVVTKVGGFLLEGPLLRLAATGPVFGLVCLAGYLATGLIGAEEREMFKRWGGLALKTFVPRAVQAGNGPDSIGGGTHED